MLKIQRAGNGEVVFTVSGQMDGESVPVPPLRDRRGDIPLLVMHFVRIYAERMNKRIERIPTEVMEALVGHSWPGNIRELQNFIERSVILTDGKTLR